ncbi:MAG TPA: hypothetical protein PK733_08760 [Clostridiales bacterium]|nr:hypothetical protein [Clostridiales bacterium]
MSTIKDKLWIWGQTPGTHHGETNPYKLPGQNRMTSLEGAYYLGVPNCCRVVSLGLPNPPFDQEAMVLDTLDRVIWSIIGCNASKRSNDMEEVIKIAKKHPNVIGGIVDDFMRKSRLEEYPPHAIRGLRERLTEEVGRKMELWTVIYTHEFDLSIKEHLAEFDVATMWTWWAKNIVDLDKNLVKLRSLFGAEKPILAGCYMWDYGGQNPMPIDLMKYQLDKYYAWLKSKEIDGIIFCSNCIADLGLEAVDITREWIEKVGGELL